MIVSVLQENLARSLNIVTKAVDSNPPLPVLANVLLETEDSRLKISATNLELSISVWIGAKVEQSGSITLPARTFSELVSSLSPERVDLRLDAATHTVHLRCGVQTSNIRGIDADEFPPINHNESADLQVQGESLREMINQTAFAAAREQNRPILTGVYVQLEGSKITMAAADGYRLAVRTTETAESFAERQDMVVPASAMSEVARIVEDDQEVGISLPTQRNSITFFAPNVTISSQLLEGRFPELREEKAPKQGARAPGEPLVDADDRAVVLLDLLLPERHFGDQGDIEAPLDAHFRFPSSGRFQGAKFTAESCAGARRYAESVRASRGRGGQGRRSS